MSEYCVVVADVSRARFFTLEPARNPLIQSGPNLMELNGLVNPEKEISERNMFSDTRSGANRSAGTSVRAFDDHRERHEEEFARRFARKVAKEASSMALSKRAGHLIFCAGTRMLGLLRKSLENGHAAAIHEVPREMTKMSAKSIHVHLAKAGVLPACVKKSRTWRSCAQKNRSAAKA